VNERIFELAEQAGLEYNFDPMLWLKYEKFAELIVRECVKFCEHESNDDEHDEYDMGMWVKAESIKTAIMKEFGIKE
jgi:hypothetical protein